MNNPQSPVSAQFGNSHGDIDPQETREWLQALEGVIEADGPERVRYLLQQLIIESRERGVDAPYNANTPYLNTIPLEKQPSLPGDPALEARIRAYLRWNAMAMVTRANRNADGIGGHIASYASLATVYEIGFNHFFRAPSKEHAGDLIFFQGHSSPGIYARAYLEGLSLIHI